MSHRHRRNIGGGPAGPFTLFGQPANPGTLAVDTGSYELGIEFYVIRAVNVRAIWFNSASGAGSLPSEIDLYNVPGGSLGGSKSSPSWSGIAGSGWVRAAFSSPLVVLPNNRYKAAVLDHAGVNWYSFTDHYWDTGAGANGITNGPLVAPNVANAQGGGQDTFVVTSTPAYPTQPSAKTNYWIDVEVM